MSRPTPTGQATRQQHRRDELIGFRADLATCFTRWGDALFELCDAALCAPAPVGSVPSLSLEPVFRRSHGSLYKALDRGRIDADSLRRLLVDHRPSDWPSVFAVDASTWDRCDAECSPERGFHYSASKHSAGQPIVAGWSYQWICQLNWAFDSWTAPVDVVRISPTMDATTATVDQVRSLVGLLPAVVPSRCSSSTPAMTRSPSDTTLPVSRAEVLCRIRDDRVLYADPPPRPNRPFGSGGRPPRHGKRIKCSDPKTWPMPRRTPRRHRPPLWDRHVTAWNQVHPRLAGADTGPDSRCRRSSRAA